MNGRLGLFAFLLLLISQRVCSQDACERITEDVLGPSDMLSAEGLLSELLTSGGEANTQTSVRILGINIVCEAQHMMEDRYRYTSVVVSFNCETTDARIPECTNSSVVNTEQFDFGCASGTWTTNILTVSESARTTNPIATLTTELDSGCILCINPDSNAVGSRTVSSVTHCEACSNCPMDLQRCYYDGDFNQVCCNAFDQGVCVTECPSPLAANPLNEFACEMECDMLSDEFGTFEFTNGRFSGSVATLTCNDERYALSNPQATCELPMWSLPIPKCTPIKCSDVSPLAKGDIVYTDEDRIVDSQVIYTCNNGYVLKGPSTRTCTADNMWIPNEEPSCICNEDSPNCIECTSDDGKVVCQACEEGYSLEDGECKVSVPGNSDAARSCDVPCIIGIVLAVIAVIVIATVVTVVAFVLYKYLNDPATKLAKTDPGGLNGVARDNPLYVDPAAVTEDGLDAGVTETTPLEAEA